MRPRAVLLLVVFGLLAGIIAVEGGARAAAWLMPQRFGGVDRAYTGRVRWEEMMVADATLGYRPRPDLEIRFPSEGRTIPVRTTSHGLGDIGFRDIGTRPPFDAVAIGDSFTFCDDVPAEACWVRQLGELAGLRIATLGVSGYSTLAEARLLARYGPVLRPRLVIPAIFANDFNDNVAFERWAGSGAPDFWAWRMQQEGRTGAARWLADHSAVYRLLDVARRGRDSRSVAYRDGGLDLVFRVDGAWLGVADARRAADRARGWQLMQRALREMRATADALGAHLLLVLIPAKEEVYWDLLRTRLPEATVRAARSPLAELRAFCEQEGFACCDLTPPLRAEAARGRQVYLRVSGHWNDAGNAVAARAVADCLAARRWDAPALARADS